MSKKIVWLLVSCLMVVSLVLASCGPAAVEEEKPVVEGKEVAVEEKEVAVEEKEVAVEEKEMLLDPATGKMVEKPRQGGVLNRYMIGDPPSFDPYEVSKTGWTAIAPYLERLAIGDWSVPRDKVNLFVYSPAFPSEYVSGQLAESWELPDSLTIIFHIRKGVYWHDKPPVNGREFVADDVVYSMGRQFGLGIAGFEEGSPYLEYAGINSSVESVEATDKYTVVIKLHTPCPPLFSDLTSCAQWCMIPHEVIETYGDMRDWRYAVGTGPFIVEDYVSASNITYSRNPNYYLYDEKWPDLKLKLPYIDGIKLFIIPDPSTHLAAVRSGKIDIIPLDWETKEQIEQTNPEMLWVRYWGSGKGLRLRNDLEPFTDIRVRKALQMAINLPEIAETYYGGTNSYTYPSVMGPGVPEPVFIPHEEMPEVVKEAMSYNPEKARQLLTEAGYPNGFMTSVDTRGSDGVDLLELVAFYLDDIGVNLQIRNNEYATGNAIWYGRKYESAWYAYSQFELGTPTLSHYYKDVGWNFANVDDPKYNAMFEEMQAIEPFTNDWYQIQRDMNLYGTQQFWCLGLPAEARFVGWQPWVKGFQGESSLSRYELGGCVNARIWIDQDLKKEMGH